MKFALLNVQGLIGKLFDKLQSPEFKNLVETNDVITVTETWTNELSCVDLEGYEHFVLNRNIKHPNAKRDSGDLIVYMKTYLVCRDNLVKMVEDCIILKEPPPSPTHTDSPYQLSSTM